MGGRVPVENEETKGVQPPPHHDARTPRECLLLCLRSTHERKGDGGMELGVVGQDNGLLLFSANQVDWRSSRSALMGNSSHK